MGASDMGSGNRVGDEDRDGDGTGKSPPVSMGGTAEGVAAGRTVAVWVDVKAACG